MPTLWRTGDDGELVPSASADDTKIAIAIGEALAEHARAIDARSDRWFQGEPVETEVLETDLTIEEVPVHVRLTLSHPSAPWHEPPDEVDASGDEEEEPGTDLRAPDDDRSVDPIAERVRTARAAFIDSALSRGHPVQRARLGSELIVQLARHADESHRSALWYMPRVVESYLRRGLPRNVPFRDDVVREIPAALEAVVAWLNEAGHLDERQSAHLHKAVDRAAPAFLSHMPEGGESSTARRSSTERSADALGTEGADASGDGAAATSARAGRAGAPHRWRPAAGQPRPAPRDPCPCGSGRRYKKCCMPR